MAETNGGSWHSPRWLYPASVAWGAVAGLLFCISSALAQPYDLPPFRHPSLQQFFLAPSTLAFSAAAAVYAAAYFWPASHRTRRRLNLVWVYPLYALLPALLLLGWGAATGVGMFGLASGAFIIATYRPYLATLAFSAVSGAVFYTLARHPRS